MKLLLALLILLESAQVLGSVNAQEIPDSMHLIHIEVTVPANTVAYDAIYTDDTTAWSLGTPNIDYLDGPKAPGEIDTLFMIIPDRVLWIGIRTLATDGRYTIPVYIYTDNLEYWVSIPLWVRWEE